MGRMIGLIPSFQWFSTDGKILSEELMTGIPRYLRILVCPRLGNQWKDEIETLQWKGYALYVWEWWKESEPEPNNYMKGSSVYDVMCRR